jgi:hypothetical protein
VRDQREENAQGTVEIIKGLSVVSWKSLYGLALRVLSCMQKRPKDSYFLPSSLT